MQANSGGSNNNNPGDKKTTNNTDSPHDEKTTDSKDQSANPNDSQNNNNTPAPKSEGNNKQTSSNGTSNGTQNAAASTTKESAKTPVIASKAKQMVLAASKKEKELQEKAKSDEKQGDKDTSPQANGTSDKSQKSETEGAGPKAPSKAKQAILAAAKAQSEAFKTQPASNETNPKLPTSGSDNTNTGGKLPSKAKQAILAAAKAQGESEKGSGKAPAPPPPKSNQSEPPPIPPRAGSAGKGLLPSKAKQMVQAAALVGKTSTKPSVQGNQDPPPPPPRPPSKEHSIKDPTDTSKGTSGLPTRGDKPKGSSLPPGKDKTPQTNQTSGSATTKSPKLVNRSSSTGRGDGKPSSRPSSFRAQSSASSGTGTTRPQTGPGGSKSPKVPHRPASNQHNLHGTGPKPPSKDPKGKAKLSGESDKDGNIYKKPGVPANPTQGKPGDPKDETGGENKPEQPSNKILLMTMRGEWSVLEQTLRSMDKATDSAVVSVNDPVSTHA